jgi:hypothetical protein
VGFLFQLGGQLSQAGLHILLGDVESAPDGLDFGISDVLLAVDESALALFEVAHDPLVDGIAITQAAVSLAGIGFNPAGHTGFSFSRLISPAVIGAGFPSRAKEKLSSGNTSPFCETATSVVGVLGPWIKTLPTTATRAFSGFTFLPVHTSRIQFHFDGVTCGIIDDDVHDHSGGERLEVGIAIVVMRVEIADDRNVPAVVVNRVAFECRALEWLESLRPSARMLLLKTTLCVVPSGPS